MQLKPGEQIVAIGDSITAGGGYLRDIDAVLAQQYPDLKIPKVINKGIGGQKAEDLVAAVRQGRGSTQAGLRHHQHRHQRRVAPAGNPHDEKVLAAYKENVAKMVDQAQKAGIKVILLTPTVIQEDAQRRGQQAAGDVRRGREADRRGEEVPAGRSARHVPGGPEAETGRSRRTG